MGLRSFCIHAHFYQPPREDPLTGIIRREVGASPYLNWNERIHAECYRPNAELGNFERISFNLGPTLSTWMSKYDPITCQRIQEQDRANVNRFGVGNAIGQAYNHTILPLSSYRDQLTQVAWGAAEFEHRFGRKPQGMWLPETAVSQTTLLALAKHGIEFTILAPWQADMDKVDVTEPYRVRLPQGYSIVVFFYHLDLSGGISFDPAMTLNADHFISTTLPAHFNQEKKQLGVPQLILLASDGELYGHHQPHREYFLAHLFNGTSIHAGLLPSFPGLWLRWFRVRRSVGIRENTSWSCHHGVARWTGNCACTPGSGRWKAQLRYAFDRLSSAVDKLYLNEVSRYIPDPWMLRERYIEVILGQRSTADLIAELAGRRLSEDTNIRIHLLLEAQRERQRMYTSCGWFFEDFDRIEPKNNLAYAVQTVRLTSLATGIDLEPYTLVDLRRVVSSQNGLRADTVFRQHMQRATLSDRKVAGN